jgi:hypothetical protein
MAACKGHTEVVEMLVDRLRCVGGDINYQESKVIFLCVRGNASRCSDLDI